MEKENQQSIKTERSTLSKLNQHRSGTAGKSSILGSLRKANAPDFSGGLDERTLIAQVTYEVFG